MNRSRWLVAALVVSLGLNLLVFGFVQGRGSFAAPHRSNHLDPTAGYFRVLKNWPQDRQDSFRPLLRQHYKGMRSHFREVPPLHTDIQQALHSEPFDPQVLDTALGELRNHLQGAQEKTHQSLIELASTMTLEERKRLSQDMRRPREGRPRHGPPRER